jgi:hypothetical protein
MMIRIPGDLSGSAQRESGKSNLRMSTLYIYTAIPKLRQIKGGTRERAHVIGDG